MESAVQESFEEYEKLVTGGCDVESLSYASGSLRVVVAAHLLKERLSISFEPVLSFRVMDEREKALIWEQFSEPATGRIFLVRDSSYLRELEASGGGFIQPSQHLHYMLCTDNDCVDIACSKGYVPKIERA